LSTVARSWLFVPGDSVRKIERAVQGDADALILDWEDAVAPAAKAKARATTLAALDAMNASNAASADPVRSTRERCWVRINALDSRWLADDIAALPAASIAGVVLPKACGPADVERLGSLLGAVEVRDGVVPGSISIIAIVTETAASVLALSDFRRPVPRLVAMLWGGEDLAGDLGVARNRDSDGSYSAPFMLARNLTLFAAAAAACEAIDAVFVNFRDQDALATESTRARADGFTSKAAIHPEQIATIHRSFGATPEERAWAEKVVAALHAGGLAVVDGAMVDAPHLRLARRILGR
jgi:citrate lyase subunit beta/citryl-CoA lyase